MTSMRRIPRVLGPRSSIAEQERKQFERSQEASFRKVLNKEDVSIKTKHIRTLVLGTHRDKNANVFWRNASAWPPITTDVTAWKFCYCLHRLCRDGHPNVLQESQRHVKMITDIGRHFEHLTSGYGPLINPYCQLLITKLKFHQHNPRYPGSLSVTHQELEAITENDVNYYFELAVEMLEYMERVLTLTKAVLEWEKGPPGNWMTGSNDCRLTPLLPCVQDSSCLYAITVKIMAKLHQALPMDMLTGHRARFYQQFPQLQQFYSNTGLQFYIKGLIRVPDLPQVAPDFLTETDSQDYETLEVKEHQEVTNTPYTPQDYENLVVEAKQETNDTPYTPQDYENLVVQAKQETNDTPYTPQDYETLVVEAKQETDDTPYTPQDYETLVVEAKQETEDTPYTPQDYETLVVKEHQEVTNTPCTPQDYENLVVEAKQETNDTPYTPQDYENLVVEAKQETNDTPYTPQDYETLVVEAKQETEDTPYTPQDYETLEVKEQQEANDTSYTPILSPYPPPEPYNPTYSCLPSPLQPSLVYPHLPPPVPQHRPPPVPKHRPPPVPHLPPRPLPTLPVYHPPSYSSLPSPLLPTPSRPYFPLPPPIPSLLPTHPPDTAPPIYQKVHKNQQSNQEELQDRLI